LRYLAVALGFGVLALILRLGGIDHQSLWLDEGYTLLFSSLPLDRLITVGGAHEHPPLYYLVVHGISALYHSYLVPRVISAVAGAIAVPTIYGLGARVFNRPAGLVAAGLLAVAPLHVSYGQDGRGYELAGLWVLLSYLGLFAALQERRRRWWVIYAAATVLCLYGEYTTVLALVPQVVLLVLARRRHLLKPMLLSWLAAAVAFLPWMGVLVGDASTIAGSYWIPPPSPAALSSTILEFLGLMTPCPSPPCTGQEAAITGLAGHELIVAGLTVAVVLSVTAWALLRRREPLLVLCLWLWVPFALVLIIAFRRSLYLDRIFLDATYPLYLLLGASTVTLWKKWRPASGVVLAFVAVGSVSLTNVYGQQSNPDWRTASRDLVAAYRPGQLVIYHPGVLQPMVRAYVPTAWHPTAQRPLWYHSYLDVPGWQHRYAGWTDDQLRNVQLRESTRGRNEVWLVTQDYTGLGQTRHWLAMNGFQLILSEMYFGDTRIELWDRQPVRQFGPVVVPSGFAGWRVDNANVTRGLASVDSGSSLSRSFRVRAGSTYVVSAGFRGFGKDRPQIEVLVRDRHGRPLDTYRDRYGRLQDSFPRTEWYELPNNGVWLNVPFGFVAPPGSTRGRIVIRNFAGNANWRDVAVYREAAG
ncbi:MAG: glycosyltransferase family 39 protein, partial [Chloroflexota bacterium]